MTLSGLVMLLMLRPKDDKAVVYSAVICDGTTYPDDDADVWVSIKFMCTYPKVYSSVMVV